MSVKVVSLGGVSFYPTEIETEDVRIGEGPVRMLGGALRFWHRAFKKKWTLSWNSIAESNVPNIRTRYRQTTTQTYIDQDSNSYTVVTTGYKETISAENISLPGTYYYNIELSFEES